MASAASDDGSLDAPLAMGEERDGDAVGERMMSMDELKQEMFKSLKDTGTIEAIRAQLRRRFIEKLKQHGRKVARDAGSGNNGDADEQAATWSVHEQLVHGLIHEYLQHHNMEHTMAVFVPEVGGPQQLLSRDAIVQMLRMPDRQLLVLDDNQSPSPPEAPPPPLVTVLLKELVRRCSVATMNSGSQTAMDLADHRLALEHQLRRVETTYLAECATRKTTDKSAQSFEERVLRYQREYDELCEKRVQQDMERFQTQALGLMRVEERKKFEREMDTVKTTMFQEHRDRLQRLHDRERDLEMDFATKKAELEASLFEARQRVFQDIEKLRVRQQDAEAKYNAETRQLAMESKRLQLLEESLKVREENMQSAVDGMVREKERAWQLEKLQWQSDMNAREQQLVVREHDLEQGVKRVAKDKETLNDMAKTIAALESELLEVQTTLSTAERRAEKLAAEKKALLTETEARDQLVSEDKLSMKSLSYENARLVAELKASQAERSKFEDVLAEKSSQVKQLEAELKGLQQELLTIKLNEANAVVDERKKFANALEAEREDARWKENELVGRLRELQSRLAESEASAEKYQTLYEDEKVHVETLRHEVSSLHTLLAQSQSAVSTRHQGGSRGSSSSRNHVGGDSPGDNTDRILMRMTEMMSQMAAMQGRGGPGNQRQATLLAASDIHPTQVLDLPVAHSTKVEKSEEEEVAKLKRDQERLERELLEQREFERKKRARDEEEQREMEQRRREFQEQLEQERLQRTKHDEELEQERRLRAAEQEAKLHDELEKQRKALDEAREAQKQLLDDQIVAEQARLQQERAREEERTRVAKEEADLAAQRLQYLREQREQEEKEQERRRRQVIIEAKAKDLPATRREPTATIVSSINDDSAVSRTNEKQDETEFVAHQSSVIEGESVRETQAVPEKQEFRVPEAVVVEEQQMTGDQSDEESFHSELDDRDQETEELSRAIFEEDHRGEHSPADNRATQVLEDEVHENDAAAHVAEAEKIEAALPPSTEKTEEELEEERRIAAEQAKKKDDEDALDVYRQRVLARRAAEKQRQQEIEEQKKREEEERAAAAELARLQDENSEEEMEKSDGSFASSAASSSGSF